MGEGGGEKNPTVALLIQALTQKLNLCKNAIHAKMQCFCKGIA